jgi:acetyl-CoA C-acetyltransferase
VATALSGADPTIMLTGPMPAARKALAKAGLTIDQIDLFEVNEAFAAVVMRFMKEMKVPHDKVNVNGGAIAMGHPLGATGAMILGTLIDELHRRKLRYGLATLCVGGGMGIATIVERSDYFAGQTVAKRSSVLNHVVKISPLRTYLLRKQLLN